MENRIGVFGNGFVGSAVQFGFSPSTGCDYEVRVYDKDPSKSVDSIEETVNKSDFIFLSVPTPSNMDGTINLDTVDKALSDINNVSKKDNIILLRSTMIPGSTRAFQNKYPDLNLVFNPEFLRERSAEVDFIENNTLLAIGTEDDAVYNIVKESHGDYPQSYAKLSPTEAELLKYYSNVYNALRIIFANSMYEVCESLGANYEKIRNAFVKRGTTTGQYTLVNKNWRGYAGVCLPKDTKALAGLVKELGLDLKLFETIDKENDKFAATVPGGMRL